MSTRRGLNSLGEVLGKVLEGRGLGRGNVLAKLQSRWAGAVGENVAKHAWPEMLRGGTLTLVVDSPVWMSQLTMLSPAIIEQVNKITGAESVAELRFRAGKPERAEGVLQKEPPFRPKKREPTASELEEVERSLVNIDDADVRTSVKRMLLAACARKKD